MEKLVEKDKSREGQTRVLCPRWGYCKAKNKCPITSPHRVYVPARCIGIDAGAILESEVEK